MLGMPRRLRCFAADYPATRHPHLGSCRDTSGAPGVYKRQRVRNQELGRVLLGFQVYPGVPESALERSRALDVKCVENKGPHEKRCADPLSRVPFAPATVKGLRFTPMKARSARALDRHPRSGCRAAMRRMSSSHVQQT